MGQVNSIKRVASDNSSVSEFVVGVNMRLYSCLASKLIQDSSYEALEV